MLNLDNGIEAGMWLPRAPGSEDVVRGQYTAGDVEGGSVPGYREEPGVAPDSEMETYVALRVYIDERFSPPSADATLRDSRGRARSAPHRAG